MAVTDLSHGMVWQGWVDVRCTGRIWHRPCRLPQWRGAIPHSSKQNASTQDALHYALVERLALNREIRSALTRERSATMNQVFTSAIAPIRKPARRVPARRLLNRPICSHSRLEGLFLGAQFPPRKMSCSFTLAIRQVGLLYYSLSVLILFYVAFFVRIPPLTENLPQACPKAYTDVKRCPKQTGSWVGARLPGTLPAQMQNVATTLAYPMLSR